MRPSPRLSCAALEDRLTPVTFGVPWPDATRLTLSFAPDGTDVSGHPNTLFQTLGAGAPTSAWEEDVLRAFQTWAAAANVNIGLVPDDGLPFGTLGLKEGDPRFGDIRIGAYPLAPDVLAVADPYDPFVGNTYVGDVILNSTAFANPATAPDLFSVVLHEAGHVLGLGHSDDPNSPMFEAYRGVRTGPTATDAADLRALYGPRPAPDLSPTGTDDGAVPLTVTGGDGGPVAATAAGDLSTPGGSDLFRISAPAGSPGIEIKVNAAGVSLLVPRLTVYDDAGRVVATSTAADPLNNDVSLWVDTARAGQALYARVDSARADVFGAGTFHLDVIPDAPAWATTLPAGPLYPADLGYAEPPSTDPANGPRLLATTPGYVEHTYYEVDDAVGPAAPVRTYTVQSADLDPGLTNVMTVALNWSWETAAAFSAEIFDAGGNRVPATVVTDKGGHYELQVRGVRSAENYQVRVSETGGESKTAGYQLLVDYSQDATHLQPFASDQLAAARPEADSTLQVVETQLFHFSLSATDWGAAARTGVRMDVFDSAGNELFTLRAGAGATRTGDLFLTPGTYLVRFTPLQTGGGPPAPVLFELAGFVESDPVGPPLRDPTLQPVDLPGPEAAAATFFWRPFSPAGVAQTPAGNAAPFSAGPASGGAITPAQPTLAATVAGPTSAVEFHGTALGPQAAGDVPLFDGAAPVGVPIAAAPRPVGAHATEKLSGSPDADYAVDRAAIEIASASIGAEENSGPAPIPSSIGIPEPTEATVPPVTAPAVINPVPLPEYAAGPPKWSWSWAVVGAGAVVFFLGRPALRRYAVRLSFARERPPAVGRREPAPT